LEGTPGVKVVWQFLEDDEDMEECGQELAQLTSLPFEFQPY
jgi:SiaC family regulatory phosphoprotein